LSIQMVKSNISGGALSEFVFICHFNSWQCSELQRCLILLCPLL